MNRRPDRLVVVATAAAVVPVIVATIRELRDGWTALGDNAQVLLRSRDVFTVHTPLIGQRSSSGTAFDFEFNNPGPLLYYLFAVPVRLWGDGGLVIATALGAIACILGIAFVLARSAGPAVATLGLVAVTGLGWTMGHLVVDPLQPHSLLHPFLLFVVLAWATAAGDAHLLPWTAGVAALLVQSYLIFAYVVPVLGATAVIALVVDAVRVRRRDPDRWRARRRTLVRVGIVTSALLVLLWLPPIVEQARAEGRGNLEMILDAARTGAPTVSAELAVGRSAEVLALWPTWLRPSFSQDWVRSGPPGLATSVGALVVMGGLLVLAGLVAWRRRDRFAFAGVVMAAVAMVTAIYNATGTIETPFQLALHHVRYLWPTALLLQLAVAVVAVRGLGAIGAHRVELVSVGLVVVLAVAGIAAGRGSLEPGSSTDLGAVVRSMDDQLDALEHRGTVLVEWTGSPFPDVFFHAFVAELGRRGIDFVMRDPVSIRRYGQTRAYEGRADSIVFLRWGVRAFADEPGAERVALASLLDDAEVEIWQRLRDEVVPAIEQGGIVLTPEGRRAATDGRLELPVEEGGARVETRALYVGRGADVEHAIDEGWISVPGISDETLRDWFVVERLVERSSVAVWVTDSSTLDRVDAAPTRDAASTSAATVGA